MARLANYYWRFILHFSETVAPLNDLIKGTRGQEIRWIERTEGAFESTKDALYEEPVLYTPDFNQPFILQTDATGTALAVVLTQKVDRENRSPTYYSSHRLLNHEPWYATIEQERLAIKWGVDIFQYYLLGWEFTLTTDHAHLKWLQSDKAGKGNA